MNTNARYFEYLPFCMPESLLENTKYMNVGCIVNGYWFYFPIAISSYNSACPFILKTFQRAFIRGCQNIESTDVWKLNFIKFTEQMYDYLCDFFLLIFFYMGQDLVIELLLL